MASRISSRKVIAVVSVVVAIIVAIATVYSLKQNPMYPTQLLYQWNENSKSFDYMNSP